MESLRLHYAPDNASLCVRLALEFAGQDYSTVLVDRTRNAQRDPDYLALNPAGLIPALETPSGPIFETGAILLWLADRHPGSLCPAPDDAARGQALSWLFWLSNTLHATLRTLFYPEQYLPAAPASLRHAARHRAATHLDLLERHWVPDHVLHMCYLAPLLRWPALYGGPTDWYDLRHWPRLHRFAQVFEESAPALRAARAEGLGPTPFSAPVLPDPPEGSAT
ncbi:glutathione S-transferase family protein [Loktanella sp. M215]|uniref:glutathione S-transferase family protein n=1 Tax=Loktanella sp. M215 TaxID=2675431 RepID=UPI001F16FB15|nr:glutathione S-transferase family protein [Loktanella sp. M215]MCF7697918.1 glutathione S-transferase [Loktanella sp. M215]